MDEKNNDNSEQLQNKSRISPASYTMSERVMKDVINRNTTDLLSDIANILRDNFEPYYPFRTDEVHDQKQFYDKISQLSEENIDIGKSIDRGFRDLIRGDKLKSEIQNLIERIVPEEIPNIGKLMEQYKGREEKLIAILNAFQEHDIVYKKKVLHEGSDHYQQKQEVEHRRPHGGPRTLPHRAAPALHPRVRPPPRRQ